MATTGKSLAVRIVLACCLLVGSVAGLALVGGDMVYAVKERLPGSRYREHDVLILTSALRNGVPPELVKAAAWQMSRFRADAVTDNGRIGLLAVPEPVASEWSETVGVETFASTDLLDPAVNLEAGTWHLARLLEHYQAHDDPVPFALAAYLAGPETVREWAAAEQDGMPTAEVFRQSIDDLRAWNALEHIIARKKFYQLRGEFER